MLHVDKAAHPGPSVLIPRKGSLDKLYYVDKPFWTVDTIFYTEIGDRLVPKFLYYHLSTQRLEELNQAAGIPSLTQSVLNLLEIPVPPLEVQQEIVRILDQFTRLEANLEEERAGRRRQYEHYRDRLLTFEEAVA
jgi:type I restriction enzyme S subunit